MKKIFTILLFALVSLNLTSQDLPLKVAVPPVCSDPNLQFYILNFDAPAKDQFSIFYYHLIYGSVIHAGEFVSDTGSAVFKDPKRNDYIQGANAVVMLKKQTFDNTGKLLNESDWLLAERKMESEGAYVLYYPKGFKHALVPNRTAITMSIYNLDAIKGLTVPEMEALAVLVKGMIPQPPQAYVQSTYHENTLAEDIMATKKQFKSLRATGLLFKGNLPKDESVLTRYPIVSERNFVITRTKGKSFLLKFYLTEDYKTFDCLDSTRIEGDVSLTSMSTCYNLNSEAIGAFANFQLKTKDDKGEDVLQQYSFAMDADYKISGWIHSVGKNKLNSMDPEICWYEADKLWVMSNNREKFFKSYVQLHQFPKAQAAISLYPTSDEEKGSEKTKFVKNFQPPVPMNQSQIAPLAEKYVPVYMTTAGESRYFIAQGTRWDDVTKSRQYMSVNIYRIDGKGKVTSIDILSDINSHAPFPMDRIIKNPNGEFFLLQYPIKVQLAFYPDRSELSPLTDAASMLIERQDKQFIGTSPYGSFMLHHTLSGTKYTILFYPKAD